MSLTELSTEKSYPKKISKKCKIFSPEPSTSILMKTNASEFNPPKKKCLKNNLKILKMSVFRYFFLVKTIRKSESLKDRFFTTSSLYSEIFHRLMPIRQKYFTGEYS